MYLSGFVRQYKCQYHQYHHSNEQIPSFFGAKTVKQRQCKRFKKEVGVSPLEYMTNLRMKSAEMLLTAMWANEYTVSEIARMCGYDDALYFSRVFKKHYGCSPSTFAKKGRTQASE